METKFLCQQGLGVPSFCEKHLVLRPSNPKFQIRHIVSRLMLKVMVLFHIRQKLLLVRALSMQTNSQTNWTSRWQTMHRIHTQRFADLQGLANNS